MSFLSKIGNFVGQAAQTVSKVAGTVSNIAGNVQNLLKAPLSQLAQPIKDMVGKALDKLPFGIGNMIKPFADKFMDKGLSSLQGSTLGGLGVFAKALPTIGKIADLASKIADVSNRVGQEFPAAGQSNLANIFAHAQAAKLQ